MNSKNEDSKNIIEKLLDYDEHSEDHITKKQWQILEAAAKVFSEKGFGESRTSDIAKEAKVAEGTIFRYYKTKKDLLMGLLIPLIIKFFRPLIIKSAEMIVENKSNKSINEVLENLFIDRLDLINKNFPLIKTIFMESAYHPEILKTVQKNVGPTVIPFINGFVEQNIEKGVFKEKDSMVITRTLMSLLLGYVILNNAFPEFFNTKNNDEEDIKKVIDIFLNGITN